MIINKHKKKTKCTLEAVVVRNNVLSQVEMHSAGGYKFRTVNRRARKLTQSCINNFKMQFF